MTTQPMRGFIYSILIAFLISCNLADKKKDKVWSELPEVTSLKNLKQTEFVTTLENQISADKNTIYTSAFLFVWDTLAKELKSPILVSDTNSNDFKLLTTSKSYINSLADSEYSVSVIIDTDKIIAKAFFNKALPFETKLQLLDEPISFDKKTNVKAFGMEQFNIEAIKCTNILYYLNDDNFILQLIPKDKQQEIVLVKGLQKFKTLADALVQTNLLIEKGKNEIADSKQSWKYEIVEGDIFSIPIIQFNIETNYKNIEGQDFFTKNHKRYFVDEAYQRTGFILNENGAVAESETIIIATVDTASAEPHPKSLVFDKPFLVIVKRKDRTNPYFVMAVNNTELLMKKITDKSAN